MRFNITKNTVGKILKIGGMSALYGLASMVSRVSINDVIDSIRYSGNVSYSDAIGAIMDSDMIGGYKKEAMELVKKDGDVEYYKTIIKVVKSDVIGSYKIDIIKNLSKEKES